jgi:hypothetical protein
MDEDLGRAELGAARHQCINSRRLEDKMEATSIVTDSSFYSTISVESEKVGSMNPPGDTDVLRTFRGVRMQRAGDMVNQYITMSIDPSNLQCLSCREEHPVLQGNKPVTVFLSDENFIPMWPGTEADKCAVVIRIEGGTLFELVDLFGDVFGKSGLPEGSVVLIGSANHLHRWGTSQFAADWTKIVMSMGRSWPTVRVGPLVPIVREDAPGGIARELTELGAWFLRVYRGNIHSMSTCWTILVTKTIANSTGATELTNPESYILTLPPSLDCNAQLRPHTYVSKCSRPSVLKGIDKGTIDELLNAIATTLDSDFRITIGIGSNSANANEPASVQERVKKLVLVGASNLHRVTGHLQKLGWDVVDLCVPGWMATPAKVEEMAERLKSLDLDGETAIVFDIFGNTTFRFENYDGSIFMPIKIGGGYHLAGDVTVCSDTIFNKQIETVLPLLSVTGESLRIVVPPQPRYLYSGCCAADEHCTNLKEPDHAMKLMGAVMHLRDTLKRKLVGKLGDKFWLADSSMTSDVGNDKTSKDRAEGMRSVSASDGVHYVTSGYLTYAKKIVGLVQDFEGGKIGTSKKSSSSSCTVAGSGRGLSHYWRGISSPTGSAKPAFGLPNHKFRREKQTKFSPYARGGGGGADGKEHGGSGNCYLRTQIKLKFFPLFE